MELETPAEEVEFEVELARKTGIDGLLRHLQVSQNSQRASDRFDRFDTCPSLSKFVVCPNLFWPNPSDPRWSKVAKKSPDDAVGELADAKLSSLEAKASGTVCTPRF